MGRLSQAGASRVQGGCGARRRCSGGVPKQRLDKGQMPAAGRLGLCRMSALARPVSQACLPHPTAQNWSQAQAHCSSGLLPPPPSTAMRRSRRSCRPGGERVPLLSQLLPLTGALPAAPAGAGSMRQTKTAAAVADAHSSGDSRCTQSTAAGCCAVHSRLGRSAPLAGSAHRRTLRSAEAEASSPAPGRAESEVTAAAWARRSGRTVRTNSSGRDKRRAHCREGRCEGRGTCAGVRLLRRSQFAACLVQVHVCRGRHCRMASMVQIVDHQPAPPETAACRFAYLDPAPARPPRLHAAATASAELPPPASGGTRPLPPPGRLDGAWRAPAPAARRLQKARCMNCLGISAQWQAALQAHTSGGRGGGRQPRASADDVLARQQRLGAASQQAAYLG